MTLPSSHSSPPPWMKEEGSRAGTGCCSSPRQAPHYHAESTGKSSHPAKVTHQHALRGSDLCCGKCNSINFCFAVHLLQSSACGSHPGGCCSLCPGSSPVPLSLCSRTVLERGDNARAWSCRLWSWWQQLGHQSIN